MCWNPFTELYHINAAKWFILVDPQMKDGNSITSDEHLQTLMFKTGLCTLHIWLSKSFLCMNENQDVPRSYVSSIFSRLWHTTIAHLEWFIFVGQLVVLCSCFIHKWKQLKETWVEERQNLWCLEMPWALQMFWSCHILMWFWPPLKTQAISFLKWSSWSYVGDIRQN